MNKEKIIDIDTDFDVETCTEKYKQHIRCKKYGDIIEAKTEENMIFIYSNKTYIIKFKLEFLYDFENGFNYTRFSDFKSNRKLKDNIKNVFENHIINNFVTEDRMSC
jgi:hypothetical protein